MVVIIDDSIQYATRDDMRKMAMADEFERQTGQGANGRHHSSTNLRQIPIPLGLSSPYRKTTPYEGARFSKRNEGWDRITDIEGRPNRQTPRFHAIAERAHSAKRADVDSSYLPHVLFSCPGPVSLVSRLSHPHDDLHQSY